MEMQQSAVKKYTVENNFTVLQPEKRWQNGNRDYLLKQPEKNIYCTLILNNS